MKSVTKILSALMLVALCAFSASASEPVKIALVIPSTIDDLAWSQAMYEGVKAVQAELGEDKVLVEVSERLWNAVDAGAAIRQYAMKGFNLIIAHGAQYQSLLTEIAPDFPETSFAYGTGFSTPEPNIFAYDPHAQSGAYLLGILAGRTTKTNIIGIVGPVEAGDAIKFNKGFVQGAKSVNPEVDVRIAYTGSFGDLVAAAEIARTQIKAGADLLTGSSQQSVGAVNVAAETKGIYWLSSDMDQKSIAPETVLAAQVYNFKLIVKEMLDSRAAGVVGGKHLELTLANGGLKIALNDNIIGNIPPEAVADMEAAKAKMIDGSLQVNIQ